MIRISGTITMASPMNFKRNCHGMGVVTIDKEERLVVFGGRNSDGTLDSIEIYNAKTERWETTGIKLKKEKSDFGFLSTNLAKIQNL